jgi:hypothetical protein
MPATRSDRPTSAEHLPYYGKYISMVSVDGEIPSILKEQSTRFAPLYGAISDEQARARYAPGKWSVKQVVAHLMDAERVFSFRAFSFSRGESKHLPSFEQDDYVNAVDFDAKPWRAIVDEFAAVRAASIALFAGMTPEMLLRRGIASDAEISVRACGYIIAGHEEYHIKSLREQYHVL